MGSSPTAGTRITAAPFGGSRYFYVDMGLERAAPVHRLVQKLRAGEQFSARGRVLHIPEASGADVDEI